MMSLDKLESLEISLMMSLLRQARKLRFILLNMDFKWLALLSFVVNLRKLDDYST